MATTLKSEFPGDALLNNKPRFRLSSLPFLTLLACLAASGASATEECVPIGETLLPASEKLITSAALIQANKDQKIILLGEHHDNMEHHRWQLQMMP